jgi:hypothetical protein
MGTGTEHRSADANVRFLYLVAYGEYRPGTDLGGQPARP